jgi:hypothetical protein
MMSGAFVAGMIAMAFLVAALFFLRFWVRTADTLFLGFSAAFSLMAAREILAETLAIQREEWSWLFLLRLAAFLLIIASILHKNVRAKRSEP